MSLDDPLEERAADAVSDVAAAAAVAGGGGDEELVLDVHVVLRIGDGRDHGLLDAALNVVDARAPAAGAPQNLK